MPAKTSTKSSTESRTEAYVDTSGLIAFFDRSDTHHNLFARLFSSPPRKLITTQLVLTEGHAWFLRRYDNFKALEFLDAISTMTFLQVSDITHLEWQEAVGLIRKFKDQKLTLTDSAGLAIMKRRKIRECWSADRHLSLCGANLATSALH